jgi:bifunctional DNase/RNase
MNARTLAFLLALFPLSCSSTMQSDPEVAVKVEAVTLDPRSNSPVLILEELEGSRRLPIWIGFSEARSIASALENEQQIRPNTHDLAKRLIDRLDARVERIVVTHLSEEIYYALIVVSAKGKRLEIDARPSDAVAIGLRYQAPLFVREAVFENSVEDLKSGDPGREVRLLPPPEQPEFDRQVATPNQRIQNANVS